MHPSQTYESDLTDTEWKLLEPLIPKPKPGGRPIKHPRRMILNAIFYLNRTSCQWSMLPKGYPPKSTVFDYFSAWCKSGLWVELNDRLRVKVRVAAGRKPSPTAPITFKSTAGRAATIITGANRELREQRLAWEPVADTPGLYRVPIKEEPATLLCDELNFYRYPSLDELRSFTVKNVALQNKPAPGPKHGYAFADGFLYVRLHPAGKDGDVNPNAHVFKASPARGPGFRGDEMDSRQRANFSMAMNGPAHVVVEGFTFESPGYCGVWVRHGNVTVRDCRFLGCRTGVRGWDRPEKKPRNLSEDVLVEKCEFSEHPMYADVAEIIEEVTALPETERAGVGRFFWWQRKGGAYSSEIGLILHR